MTPAELDALIVANRDIIRPAAVVSGARKGELDDIEQDVLLVAFRRVREGTAPEPEAMRRWLAVVATRVTWAHGREARQGEPYDEENAAAHLPTARDPIPDYELWQEAWALLGRMTGEEEDIAAALMATDTTVDAAKRLRIPFGTFWTRFRKMRERLRMVRRFMR